MWRRVAAPSIVRAALAGAAGMAGFHPAIAEDSKAAALVFLGTSLTAGYGLDPSEAYPALIAARVAAARLPYRVVNAGVSGETSAGARRRLDWVLRQETAVLVIETGANDGLRGQEPETTRENIQAMIDRARHATPLPKVVLAGMLAPPNYGSDYAARFAGLYPELARKNRVVLIPFLLEGVAGVPSLNQADGVHPTAAGHRVIAETVWKALAPLLGTRRAGVPGGRP